MNLALQQIASLDWADKKNVIVREQWELEQVNLWKIVKSAYQQYRTTTGKPKGETT